MVVDELANNDTGSPAATDGESKIDAITSTKNKQMVVVYGDSGTGKTAFICRLIKSELGCIIVVSAIQVPKYKSSLVLSIAVVLPNVTVCTNNTSFPSSSYIVVP